MWSGQNSVSGRCKCTPHIVYLPGFYAVSEPYLSMSSMKLSRTGRRNMALQTYDDEATLNALFSELGTLSLRVCA